MSLEYQALDLRTFADGKLLRKVNDKLAEIVEAFRKEDDGEIDFAKDEATIAISLGISRDPSVNGFKCVIKSLKLNLPAEVCEGTPAVVRDGVLVVAVETIAGDQVRLVNSDTPRK